MSYFDCVPEAAVVALNLEQRRALAALLDAERAHASRWWTMLNEMRCRGQLPEWVMARMAGTATDYDRWEEDRVKVNCALFGKRKYIHSVGEPELVVTWIDDVVFEIARRPTPVFRVDDAESLEQLQEPVRQHRSSQITLGSTNERKSS